MSATHAVLAVDARGRAAPWAIACGGLAVSLGALLLGLQLDANGDVSGTGHAPLAIGALLALAALLARYGGPAGFPRDPLGAFAAAASFFGLAALLGGVLAPGGPWMFAEVCLLLGAFALRRPSVASGSRWIGGATIGLLASMLVFRLWITWQGSEHRWQVLSVDVPVLSSIPLELLAPIRSISLGSFTPHELGFPPAGLDFGVTTVAWALGFALALGGLFALQAGAREHENDRIDALIRTLPAELAALVERLLPEEEWESLGLHGLSERRLAKRIEALVGERIRRQREFQAAWEASALLARTNPGGFSGGILQALADPGEPRARRGATVDGGRP
jgi:hypothetical protein